MPEILIAIRDKLPYIVGDITGIVGYNSDYSIRFDFDDDWTEGEKDVYFVRSNGYSFAPVKTTDDTAAVPIQVDIDRMAYLMVGVSQGDVETSRPCSIALYSSILDEIDDDSVQPGKSMWKDFEERLDTLEKNAGSSEGTDADIFWATYNVTTMAELDEAYEAGKTIMLNAIMWKAPLLYGMPDMVYRFSCSSGGVEEYGSSIMIFEIDYMDEVKDENGKAVATWRRKVYDTYGGTVYRIESDETDIDKLTAGISPVPRDILLVTNSTGIMSAYLYDPDLKWVACTGNLDASKVIFPKNILLSGNYTQVGNIRKDSADAVGSMQLKGRSVLDLVEDMFDTTLQPKIVEMPRIEMSVVDADGNELLDEYEIGTVISGAVCKFRLVPGSYTYGPETGVVPKSDEYITATVLYGHVDNPGYSNYTAFRSSGATEEVLPDFRVKGAYSGGYDGLSVELKIIHTAGVTAHDNKDDPSNPAVQIPEGTITREVVYARGYYKKFYGTLEEKGDLTSDVIRGLENAVKSEDYGSGRHVFKMAIPVGAIRAVIALPGMSSELYSVIDSNGLGADIVSSFKRSRMEVYTADNYSTMTYAVYVLDFASPAEKENTYTITASR